VKSGTGFRIWYVSRFSANFKDDYTGQLRYLPAGKRFFLAIHLDGLPSGGLRPPKFFNKQFRKFKTLQKTARLIQV
jgi:hypothetical protein